VFILRATDANCDAIIDMMCARYPFGVIAQEFLPDVTANDRRLLVINGQLKAVFKRTPKAGTIRGNVAVGGTAKPCDVSDADHMIAKRLAPFLVEHGVMLAGVDAVGDRLIEVNITSPTGLRIAERLYGQNLAKYFWDAAQCASFFEPNLSLCIPRAFPVALDARVKPGQYTRWENLHTA
jgi:glutathione synthase